MQTSGIPDRSGSPALRRAGDGGSLAWRHGLDVTVSVPSGLSLLLGPNGCGKSTFLKIAAGIERPDEGEALVEGRDLWRSEAAARRGIAYVPEHPDLTPFATIREILKLVCRLRGEALTEVDRALRQTGLEGLGRRSVRELSMGERRRSLVAAAMIGRPSVLLLDEPLEAMDRPMREQITRWILNACAEGAAVIVATHEFETFEAAASRALTVRRGAIHVLDPLPSDVAARRRALESLAAGAPSGGPCGPCGP